LNVGLDTDVPRQHLDILRALRRHHGGADTGSAPDDNCARH